MAVTSTGRIARRNVQITFQARTVHVDEFRNHTSSWEDYFSCFAYASTYTAEEKGEEVITEERSVTFETRWCPELSAVTSTGYRIVFGDDTYNILSVDRMNYQYKTLRFTCRKEARS